MRRVQLLQRFSRKRSFPFLSRLRPAAQDWDSALSPPWRQIPFHQQAAKRRQQASSYKPKCPGCGIFDHVYKDCFYRSHPYFNKDPSIEYAQSPVGIRYCNTFGGRYIKERDMDPSLPKKDRGASMQRKRSRLDDFAGLSGKSLGSERSVSRSRD